MFKLEKPPLFPYQTSKARDPVNEQESNNERSAT